MKTLHMTVGLPRSGKSTLAKELGYPIVELDAIREVMHGTPYRKNMEYMVRSFGHLMVEALFEAGHQDVTLDSTAHTAALRREWESAKWTVEHHVVNTDHNVCCQRAVQTGQSYLVSVIERMYRDFEEIGGNV